MKSKNSTHSTRGVHLKLFVLVLMVLFTLNVKAQITVNVQNKPIKEIFKVIESKCDYRFFYNESLKGLDRITSINLNNAGIEEAMKTLLQNTEITYKLDNNNLVVLIAKEKDNTGTSKKVTGVITGSDNEPIIGASILVKGTKVGTISDLEGRFSLEVPEKSIISVSYVGYKTQEFAAGYKTPILIKLAEDVETLNEVVVTALGIKREEKALGYAVQAVKGDIMQTVKGIDMATSLTGKVAGLMIKNSTEFAESPEISLRGEAPLIVIDGVPYGNMSLKDVPADDIEKIDVLKGSTAAALYGARGGRGTIMITTKMGNKTKGLVVSFNSGTMFTAGFLAIPELQSTYGRVVNTATNTYTTGGDGSWGVPMDGRDVIQWDPISKSWRSMPYLPRGKDNFKNFLEQGYILNNNISIVQQGETGSLRASATWVSNKGQYPNSQYDKYTYNIGGEIKANKFVLSSSIAFNKQVSPNIGFSGYTSYDPMYSLLVWSAADYDVRDYKDYWLVPNESQNNSYTDSSNNPYFDRYERTHSKNKDIMNGNLAMAYDISKWLKLSLRSGFDTYSDRQDVRVSKGSLISAGSATLIPNGTQVWGESANGSYNTGISRGYSFNNDLILTGNKTFGKFTVDGLIGGTIYYKQDEGIEAKTKDGLTIPGFYSLKSSVSPAQVSSMIYRQQVNSLYGRLALSWRNMIYAEGTVRNDWNSTLSSETRSYLYPSLSGSFIASELLPKYAWLSFWKIRSSWTATKEPAGIYDINSVFDITNSAWGSMSSARYPSSLRSPIVLPESSESFEVGTAASLLKNRISIDLTYYTKRYFDGLTWGGISSSTGFTSNYVNTEEEITKKGWEVTTNFTPIKQKNWQWDITVNWSKYSKYYTKLDPIYSEKKPWVKVGERVDVYSLYDYLRDKDGNIIHSAGKPQYSDYESKYGYSDPDWIWGLSSTLKYKNLQLAISLDGRFGGLTQTITEMYMWKAGSHPKSVTPERYLDATTGSEHYIGKGVKVVSGAATFDAYGNITSDNRVYAPNDVAITYESYTNTLHKGTAWGGAASPADVFSTTFLKIREISLTYDVPKSIYKKIHMSNLSLSAIGQNIFLWSKQFKYSDPDGGYDNFSDPSIRYLGFNLKVTF